MTNGGTPAEDGSNSRLVRVKAPRASCCTSARNRVTRFVSDGLLNTPTTAPRMITLTTVAISASIRVKPFALVTRTFIRASRASTISRDVSDLGISPHQAADPVLYRNHDLPRVGIRGQVRQKDSVEHELSLEISERLAIRACFQGWPIVACVHDAVGTGLQRLRVSVHKDAPGCHALKITEWMIAGGAGGKNPLDHLLRLMAGQRVPPPSADHRHARRQHHGRRP